MTAVRAPAIAGSFYPANRERLARDVDGFLSEAGNGVDSLPKAIIVPHAGYIYSGAVAARAYASVAAGADRIRRIVMLGPAHRMAVLGMAAPSVDAFRTPLGDVPLDRPAIDSLSELQQMQIRDDAHREEHCLEVQLPFLQRIFKDFKLIPLIVGDASPYQVTEVLERLWGGPETLIVISSDLSHYYDYETAQTLDARAADAIETKRPDGIQPEQACGQIPIAGLLISARKRGLTVTRMDLRNSGDTGAPRNHVVGYGSWIFTDAAGTAQTAQTEGNGKAGTSAHPNAKRLLRSAASTLRYALQHGEAPEVGLSDIPDALKAKGATFVTLKHGSQLRGCVGTVEATRPLLVDVVRNAFGAGFKDPRFPPLSHDELANLSISISLLSEPARIDFSNEDDLLQLLRPKVDGLILHNSDARAVFLPQVWNDLAEPKDFLRHLKAKAGIARKLQAPGDRAERFTAQPVGTVILNAMGRTGGEANPD